MFFLVFSIHLSIRPRQAAHMAPPWHAGAGGHGRRQSQPSSACRQRPTKTQAYGKACRQELQNGPFRLAKRPMQHCQTAHIARRNGPFCNGRAASHATRCRPGCLPKQARGRQDRTPPRLRKQSAQGRDHPQQATIQNKGCRASRRNTLKKSESIYIISQYHCNCLLQDAMGREPHRNEATAAATQRSVWNAPGHGRCHACKDKYHITIIASLDARISLHIAYKPHNPQNRTIIMPDKGHKSQQQARATGVSAELPSRRHAALGNRAEGRGRTERQAKWRKTGKAIGKHGAHFQTTAGRHDGPPLAKATGMLPRASTTIARYACRIYIRHHPKKSSRHGRATPPPCCMLTMQGSNIMPAAAMQGMLPDAFLAACIYRCT